MLKVGLSEVNITPAVGVSLVGYFEDRKSTGVHDPLLAQAFLFETSGVKCVLITADLVALSPEVTGEAKSLISEQHGIPPGNIFIHTTHTHTGPATVSAFGVEKDQAYLSYLPALLSGSVRAAQHNLFPARLGFGVGRETDISFNRRHLMKDGTVRTNPGAGDAWEKIIGKGNPDIVRPAGPIDPDVAVLKIEDDQGSLRGILVNFALHLDTIGGNLISADYPGVMRRVIRRVRGCGVQAGFFNGCCGNLAHIDFRTGKIKPGYFEHTEFVGRILAAEALRVTEKTDCRPVSVLKCAAAELTIPVRSPDPKELRFARKLVEGGPDKLDPEEKKEWQRRSNLFGNEIAWAREMLFVVDSGRKAEKITVGAMRLGGSGFAFLPGEVFVEYGLRIKAESRLKPTVVVELTNSGTGYLPTREAFKQGTGYEERLARSSFLVPEAGDLITDAALRLLNGL